MNPHAQTSSQTLNTMKKGDKISEEALVEEGWVKSGYFSDCEIRVKGNNAVLWNPRKQTIDFCYQIEK